MDATTTYTSTDIELPMSPAQALNRGFTVNEAAAAVKASRNASALAQVERQGFRVGDLGLAVRYEDGSELTEMPALYALPNAPSWFLGVANLHGALTPVFDLAAYAGVQATPAKPMLLVLSHGADAAGIVIDGLPRRLRWTQEQAADTATAPQRLAPHVRAAALVGHDVWFDLDCAALLDALEQAIGTAH